MKFQPLSEDEINELGLLPVGEYDFTINAAIEKTSAKGNDMFELSLSVFEPSGAARSNKDWILPLMMKKFKHCIDACGLTSKYESGEIVADDFVGKSGKLKLIIGSYTNNEGIEIKTNRIDDYVKRPAGAAAMPKEVDDDSIPF